MKNRWMYGLHYDHAKAIVDILQNDLKEVPLNILHKVPNIFRHSVQDVQTFISLFQMYEITGEMIKHCREIFNLNPSEFHRRIVKVLSNPLTAVFHKHPKFLTLVKHYYIILPRLRYLEYKKFKYATVHSLTTFHNYLELLVLFNICTAWK